MEWGPQISVQIGETTVQAEVGKAVSSAKALSASKALTQTATETLSKLPSASGDTAIHGAPCGATLDF
jgi:hypothetical protein